MPFNMHRGNGFTSFATDGVNRRSARNARDPRFTKGRRLLAYARRAQHRPSKPVALPTRQKREKVAAFMHVWRSARMLILTVPVVSLMAQQPNVLPENRASFYSLEKEMALGKQMASEVHRRTRAIEDTSIEEYVTSLGRRLANAMLESKTPFTFTVITDDACPPTHEPPSLPGGYIFVPAALFLEAQSEAEFAGMLAHSMAHVAARHATRQVSPVQGRDIGSIPLIFLGGWAGICSGGVAVPSGFRTTQRTYELEADTLAIATMARVGFDPTAFVSYIQRVQIETARSGRFSSLPTRDERVTAMNPIIEGLPRSIYQRTQGDFVDIQDRVRRFTQSPEPAGPPKSRRN
jgi:predicted Zn-dependent protease